MFYEFWQNNSGGHYHIDIDVGLNHKVIIEADTRDEAIEKAFNIGIYFDGVRAGRDCDCCGDRWSSPSELDTEDLIDELSSSTSVLFKDGNIKTIEWKL